MTTVPAFETTPRHAVLHRFVGTWAGPATTFFDPESDPVRGAWHLEGSLVLGGRFVRLAYTGTVGDKPHAGELLLAYEEGEKRYTVAWTDTFHNGTQILVSHGPPEWAAADRFEVLGSFAAGEQRWGWRTRLRADADTLHVTMFVIEPSGHEQPSVDVKLKRA